MFFADSTGHQSLPSTGSLQHLLWELGLCASSFTCGEWAQSPSKQQGSRFHPLHRAEPLERVSDLPEQAVREKPICNRTLKVGIARNGVLVTMPNAGIKSIYQGLGTVKNRTFKLTWTLCPPQFSHLKLWQSPSHTSKRQKSIVYQKCGSQNPARQYWLK